MADARGEKPGMKPQLCQLLSLILLVHRVDSMLSLETRWEKENVELGLKRLETIASPHDRQKPESEDNQQLTVSKETNIDIISKSAKAWKAASLCFCVNLLGRVTAQGVWMDSCISLRWHWRHLRFYVKLCLIGKKYFLTELLTFPICKIDRFFSFGQAIWLVGS